MSTNKKTVIIATTLPDLFGHEIVVEGSESVKFDLQGEAEVSLKMARALLKGNFESNGEKAYKPATADDKAAIDGYIDSQIVVTTVEKDRGEPVRVSIPQLAGIPLVAPDNTRLDFDDNGQVVCGSETAAELVKALPEQEYTITVTPLVDKAAADKAAADKAAADAVKKVEEQAKVEAEAKAKAAADAQAKEQAEAEAAKAKEQEDNTPPATETQPAATPAAAKPRKSKSKKKAGDK